ncbi:SurA N-terminal domain-containing protein [Streptomyces cavernicola]|uniref:SurA N-terminal domain-containing protein n=1 Tax=Streptomyces cavernicola TaxID=3043613 RepID=A0ABT6S612_9ACTN|nr:SurA N-terminal domain-containing protein [Streptomyces sp. B-S-A6]MDI3403533.1 SurA N-terminal domain-containing protein [Streptomyces sp. B-S-A6]
MHRRRRTALALSAALIAAAPLLTACGDAAHPGAAAVVGGERITVAQLQSRVQEVRAAQQSATEQSGQYAQAVEKTGGLTRDTLQSLVLDRVLHRAATDAGVHVSRKEVQGLRGNLEKQAGGAKALEMGWLQQYNIPASRIDDSLRTEIEAQKLYGELGADPNTAQGQARFWKALSKASESLDINLNPRYGAWDVEKSRRTDVKPPWVREAPAPKQQA